MSEQPEEKLTPPQTQEANLAESSTESVVSVSTSYPPQQKSESQGLDGSIIDPSTDDAQYHDPK